MYIQKLLMVIVFCAPLAVVQCVYECCPDQNILLSNMTCLTPRDNGNHSLPFSCKGKLFIDNGDFSDFGFLRNGTELVDESGTVTNYCHAAKIEESEIDGNVFIVCYQPTAEDEFFGMKNQVIICLILISACFTILTILVYLMVPSLLDQQAICIVHSLAALACVYIFLAVLRGQIDGDHACKTFAYLMYFATFYMFCWQGVLSFHIWRTTVKPNMGHGIKWMVPYHSVGIGGPTLFLVIILLAHYSPSEFWLDIRPGFGDVSCWFSSVKVQWIYFWTPISMLLIVNGIFYLWTIAFLWNKVNNSRKKILKYRCKLCIRLYIIMGMTWVIEVATFAANLHSSIFEQVLVFLLDLVNILQGVLIFLVFVVFRRRVRRALANKNLCNIPFPSRWRQLEDEEMDEEEDKTNNITVLYKDQEDDLVNVEFKS